MRSIPHKTLPCYLRKAVDIEYLKRLVPSFACVENLKTLSALVRMDREWVDSVLGYRAT